MILNDTDHLWGIGGDAGWVWKSFLRGLNPVFMDPYDGRVLSRRTDRQWPESVRKAQGHALAWSRRVDLATLTPHGELASSQYCLANPGVEYLAYRPATSTNLMLTLPLGKFSAVWFEIASGRESKSETLTHVGARHTFTVPFDGDGMLHLKAVK